MFHGRHSDETVVDDGEEDSCTASEFLALNKAASAPVHVASSADANLPVYQVQDTPDIKVTRHSLDAVADDRYQQELQHAAEISQHPAVQDLYDEELALAIRASERDGVDPRFVYELDCALQRSVLER